MSEHAEQVKVARYALASERLEPEYALLYAIPNGSKRTIPMAVWMKAEGLKRGVPDLFLAVRRRQFSGLYIEMKKPKERPSAEQLAWHAALRAQGYLVFIAYSAQQAIDIMREYLALSAPTPAQLEAARALIAARHAEDRRRDLAKWQKKSKARRAA